MSNDRPSEQPETIPRGLGCTDVVIAWFVRDASFWSKPDTHKVKRVHVQHPEAISRYGHARALCGNIPLIKESGGGEWVDPPERQKCKRCLRCLESKQ